MIGAILINPEIKAEINLIADDFYIHRHRFIWDALGRLEDKRQPIDLLTLSSEMDNAGQLSEIGGPAYLTSLVDQVPSSLHAVAYASVVKDMANRRKQITIANDLASSAYDLDQPIEIAPVIDRLITTQPIERGAVTLSDTLRIVDDQVSERARDPKRVWGIPTGLIDLDDMTGGLHLQETTIIVGPPKIGKTTLVLQWALYASIEKGTHVALYEMEMDTVRLAYRLINMLGGPSPKQMRTGYVPDEKWPHYTHALDRLSAIQTLHVSDNPMLTTSMLRADLARLRSRYPIKMVVLDYLNLLADSDGKDDNERGRLRSKRFRAICREANVAGVTVQSLNKEGVARSIPMIQDISGPSEIGYDVDWAFTLAQDETRPNIMQLVPLAGRDAEGIGTIELRKKGLLYENLATKVKEPPWIQKDLASGS